MIQVWSSVTFFLVSNVSVFSLSCCTYNRVQKRQLNLANLLSEHQRSRNRFCETLKLAQLKPLNGHDPGINAAVEKSRHSLQITSMRYFNAECTLTVLFTSSSGLKKKHKNFSFVHIFFIFLSFVFIRHTCNSKNKQCMQILNITNNCSANEDPTCCEVLKLSLAHTVRFLASHTTIV